MKFITLYIPRGIMILLISLNACKSVPDENLLQLSTDNIEFIADGIYKFNGTLIQMGEGEIKQHGFCWCESGNPDIGGPSAKLGSRSSTGTFSTIVTGLSENTTYQVRAYAISNSLPVYADEIVFTTEQVSGNKIIDVDGNIYQTVQIGDQTWMAENLKVTRYADETPIPLVEDQQVWFHFTRESSAYCWYENVLTNGYVYGALYTWPAAMRGLVGSDSNPSGVQGVCLDGWHLPSDNEWKQLEIHLGMSEEEADMKGWRGIGVGGKLKQEGTLLWDSPNSGATNATGFNAFPGGYRHGSGHFHDLETTARFWSTSHTSLEGYGWFRGLDYDNTSVFREFSGVYRGYSVRCVKNEE